MTHAEKVTRLYKLTNEHGQTYRQTQWGPEVTHTAPGTGELCSAGWIHAYTSPYLALLLNPIHAEYKPCRLWRADGVVGCHDHGLKVGCTRLTILVELVVPEITPEQRVTFALWCALAVYPNQQFVAWAEDWLMGHRSGKTAEAARTTAWAAGAAAWATAGAAAGAAAWAAEAAAEAAAREAARAAAWAAGAAAWAAAGAAAWAAAGAAEAAAEAADFPLDDYAKNACLPLIIRAKRATKTPHKKGRSDCGL